MSTVAQVSEGDPNTGTRQATTVGEIFHMARSTTSGRRTHSQERRVFHVDSSVQSSSNPVCLLRSETVALIKPFIFRGTFFSSSPFCFTLLKMKKRTFIFSSMTYNLYCSWQLVVDHINMLIQLGNWNIYGTESQHKADIMMFGTFGNFLLLHLFELNSYDLMQSKGIF